MSLELHTVSASDLPYYLMERGLVDRDAVVDGDLHIADVSRRNRNYEVLRRSGPSFFVKQSRHESGATADSVRREAVCYELAAKQEGFGALRPFLPEYHGYDVERNLLVLGLAAGAHSASRELSAGFPGVGLAVLAGRTLGRFHRTAAALPPLPAGALPDHPPWMLSIHRMPAEAIPVVSTGQRALAELLRGDARVARALDLATSGWRRQHLVHGDLKWDNLLVDRDADGPATCRMVDWELAHVGDPAWDLGALLQSLVCLFVPHASSPGAAQVWARLREAASGLATAYGEGRELGPRRLAETVHRAVHLGGARAVQSAFEMLHGSPEVSPEAHAVLAHGLGMIEDPAAWSASLLGAREEARDA